MHIKQKSSVTLTVVSQKKNRAVYIAPSESCEHKTFYQCQNKVERKYIQEQQPNQFHCYNQIMGFVNRIDQSVANYRIGNQMKNGGDPRLFEWWMLLFRVRGYCIVLTKIKAMCLCLFQFFEKILSMQFFLNIHRKADDPRAMQEFEISHQIFMMTQNTGVLRPLQASKMECFCENSQHF